MLRGIIKSGLACALHRTGADRWVGRHRGGGEPPVVAYHRIVESFSESARSSIPAMLTARKTLERHLAWMGARYRFISLADLRQRPGSRSNGGKEAVAVSFDDGYRDFYYHAFPLLRKKGIPAAVFVVTGLIGTSRLQNHDRLFLLLARAFERWQWPGRELKRRLFALDIGWPELTAGRNGHPDPAAATQKLLRSLTQEEVLRLSDELPVEVELDEKEFEELLPLTWEMVSEMHRAGITIGSHTRNHAWLTGEDPQKVLLETRGSREELEKRLGEPIVDFAYPDGQFDPEVVRAVAAAGYLSGYTTCLHRDPDYPMLTVPRKSLWENACLDSLRRFSPDILSCQLNWAFDLASGCDRDHR